MIAITTRSSTSVKIRRRARIGDAWSRVYAARASCAIRPDFQKCWTHDAASSIDHCLCLGAAVDFLTIKRCLTIISDLGFLPSNLLASSSPASLPMFSADCDTVVRGVLIRSTSWRSSPKPTIEKSSWSFTPKALHRPQNVKSHPVVETEEGRRVWMPGEETPQVGLAGRIRIQIGRHLIVRQPRQPARVHEAAPAVPPL